ncbi:hypothetical protein F183_A00090 [Bryobacterales bacterium F-183]|nr:hypothetical protein F183_A00090 [Bryobacterales bacterium F-183]
MRDAFQIAFLLFSLAANLSAQSAQTESLEPRVAKAGTVITIKGVSLDKDRVDEVYLTDHRFDLQVKVLKQSATSLEVRVPPFVKPSRLQLLYLTGGDKPVYLEQPFFVEIVDAEDMVAAERPQITSIAPLVPVKVVKQAEPIVVVAPELPQSPPVAAEVPVKQPEAVPAPVKAEIVPARLLKRTPIALPRGLNGGPVAEVQLVAHVAADGTVRHVQIVRGNPMIAQTAATALRQWVYEPARRNGVPMESEVALTLQIKSAAR